MHVDVLMSERRQAGHILAPDLEALLAELPQRRVHVDGVPEHDDVDDQTERAQLVLLPLAIPLAQLATLAVENGAGKHVPALAAIELDEDAATVRLIIEVVEQVRGLDDAAELGQGPGEPRRAVVGL